jgi:hypothetical protein
MTHSRRAHGRIAVGILLLLLGLGYVLWVAPAPDPMRHLDYANEILWIYGLVTRLGPYLFIWLAYEFLLCVRAALRSAGGPS